MVCNVIIYLAVDFCAGKKRVWIPDEKEAYIEVEIKDTDGDRVMVETKDGRVSNAEIALALF